MPLTSRDAFKVGFLQRCLADGLAPEQMLSCVKRARDLLEKRALFGEALTKAVDLGQGALGAVAGYGLPLALAGPPIIGGLGGYGLAKATDIDDTDIKEIKDRELLDEYGRQTQKLLRARAVRDYQKQKQRTGRVFI